METQTIQKNAQYSDPATEAYIQTIKKELTDICEIQGRHDGAGNRPQTVDDHRALVLNMIENKTQTGIDFVQKKFLIISGAAVAQLVAVEADAQEKNLRSAINDDEHELLAATNEATDLKPSVKNTEFRNSAFIGGIITAVFEGMTSFPAFRHYHLPLYGAVIAAFVIAFAVWIGAHFSGGFIKAGKTMKQTIARYIICMVPAVILFTVLGIMRASAISYSSNLHVGTDHVSSHSGGIVAGFALTAISSILYALALFLSAKFHVTDEEKRLEKEYKEKCEKVAAIQAGIDGKENTIVKIRYEKFAKMDLAVRMYEYAMHLEILIINNAHEIAESYKQKNLRYRSDGIPRFFSHKPVFNFKRYFGADSNHDNKDTDFNNNKNHQKNEQIFEIH